RPPYDRSIAPYELQRLSHVLRRIHCYPRSDPRILKNSGTTKYMRIFILLGHTDHETLSGAMADTYEREARASGHEVRRMNIGEMQFDPILHKGYKVIQQLEQDLKTFQENE